MKTTGSTSTTTNVPASIDGASDNDPYSNPLKINVKPKYDASFTSRYKYINIRQLTNESSNNEMELLDDNDEVAEAVPYLVIGVLLKIIMPSTKSQEATYSFYKRQSAFNKKQSKSFAFKRMMLFGSYGSKDTFTVIERNNVEHSTYFMRDMEKKDVGVGALFAILNPRYTGSLKMGSALIETSYPFQMISRPALKIIPYEPNLVTDEMSYFVLKGQKLKRFGNFLPVVINTLCGADACDRIGSTVSNTTTCGCFTQFSRQTGTARNVVFKLAFAFNTLSGSERVDVTDYTSLRTTRLLFKKQMVTHDYTQLSTASAVSLIDKAWQNMVLHVNSKSGWTIIGWYVRSKRDTDDVDNDVDPSFYTTLKTNIVYVYPTKILHKDIPDKCLLTDEALDKTLSDHTGNDNSNELNKEGNRSDDIL